jgi:hypothetical protein
MGFTKLDEDFFDSSLVAEGPVPTAVFVLLLAKVKPDGVARVAATVVGGRLGLTAEQTAHAFDVLQSPDPHSRSLEHEGRRIQRVDGGWLILNYKKRRDMGLREAVREYDRGRKKVRKIPEDSGSFPESSASASVVVPSVEGVQGEDARGEALIHQGRVAKEREFYALVSQLARLEDMDGPEVARTMTSYEREGKRVGGKVRPETLSDGALDKSLADGRAWLEEAKRGKSA